MPPKRLTRKMKHGALASVSRLQKISGDLGEGDEDLGANCNFTYTFFWLL